MNAHLSWIRATAALGLVAGTVIPAAAQYPYTPAPQQQATTQATQMQTTAVAPYGVPIIATPPTTQQAVPPVSVGLYPQTAAPYVPSATYVPPSTPYPQVAQQPTYPTYSSLARQPEESSRVTPGSESMPSPQRPERADRYNGLTDDRPLNGQQNGAPDANVNGHNGELDVNGANGHITNGTAGYLNGANGYPAAGCYPASGNQCDYGVSQYMDAGCYDTQWFGGVYYLYMERDRPTPVKLTVEVDHTTAPDPYYPDANATLMVQPDHDFRSGVEVRVGSTFTLGGWYDDGWGDIGPTQRCGPCSPQVWAWEFGWWGIDDDSEQVTVFERFGRRIYGMVNFAGLDFGGVAVSDLYGYGLPIDDPALAVDGDVRVLAQRVRTSFDAQNFELNIFRFPMCQTGCMGGGCEPCGPSFSMFGSCGVRYFRADEDFMYATEYTTWSGGAWDQAAFNGFTGDNANELFYNIDVENHLVGPQIGWSMNYCHSRWNFFLNSTFGVFNNHIEHRQRMTSGGGDVTFASDGSEFYCDSEKDDLSFLGELRLGGAYDINCNWRAVLAYRAVAVTGIATATDQIPSDFGGHDWVHIIDSDNSLIVHGLQTGVECRY